MKRTILGLALLAYGGVAQAQSWSFLGAHTVGSGNAVLGVQAGWPDLTVSYHQGTSPTMDIGGAFELIYGIEGTTNTEVGIGLKAPIRFQLTTSDKTSVLASVSPGIKVYFTDDTAFGIQFPVGIVWGYRAQPNLTIGLGADMGLTLFFTPDVIFVLAPQVGPYVEYHLDDRTSVGVNTRFGPAFFIADNSTTEFAFRIQAFFGYRL